MVHVVVSLLYSSFLLPLSVPKPFHQNASEWSRIGRHDIQICHSLMRPADNLMLVWCQLADQGHYGKQRFKWSRIILSKPIFLSVSKGSGYQLMWMQISSLHFLADSDTMQILKMALQDLDSNSVLKCKVRFGG